MISARIKKVDPLFRKRLFVSYTSAILILSLVGIWGARQLRLVYLGISSSADQEMFVSDIQFIFLISFILPAFLIIRTGVKIIREKEYPYSSMKVLRDTPIKEGSAAVKVGRRFVVLGVVTALLVIASAYRTEWIHQDFVDNPMGSVSAKKWEEMEKGIQHTKDSLKAIYPQYIPDGLDTFPQE